MGRFGLLFLFIGIPVTAQTPDAAFFEAKIRPVIATKCVGCHSSASKAPMGGLVLDTKSGLLQGGSSGPPIVPGKPAESLLIKALSYTDPQLQMPPTGKLPDSVRADFEQWIAAGAVDPRVDTKTTSQTPKPLKGMSIEDGKKWWAFQPVKEMPAPSVRDASWGKNKIDAFILARLEQEKLKPSETADSRTLVIRAYIDLVGYRPSYDEIQAFVDDKSPNAWEALVDRLQALPQYGERWGRHWMDVARFGEDNPTAEATNPPYPYAWRYRDWIIEAVNKDVPYDKFVKLQLAADLIPGTPREDLRALGYLGAAPTYHKDLRLSKDVIGGFLSDDWDERVDAVSRGVLGMTVACARCHDHKFDPILTKDYYGLVGVFASTTRIERPMFDIDPKVEERYMWVQQRLTDLHYSANLLTGEASTVEGSAERVAKWKAEIETLKAEMLQLNDKYPQLVKSLEKNWTFVPRKPPTPVVDAKSKAPAAPADVTTVPATVDAEVKAVDATAKTATIAPTPLKGQGGRNRPLTSTEPFMNAVYDAAQYVDGADEHFTVINYKAGEPRDFPVLLHGNVATPGDMVPRHFPTVLAKSDKDFKNGSGRMELGEKIFTESASLAARVIVNRVWGWHFGRGLVITPSDFGVQGEKPSNAALLDDLSARFIANGWSIKWLNREIMLSAAYKQSSRPRADGETADVLNTMVWRMNPRRVDIETYRDSLLRAAGRLDEKMYGPSEDIENADMTRRTVYGRVSRIRLSNLLKTYDFPDPMQTAGNRDLTTTSLQQFFVMNSLFMHQEAGALVEQVKDESDTASKMRILYRKVLSRDPSPKELDLAISYLVNGTLDQYAQVLLSTNEEIFWP